MNCFRCKIRELDNRAPEIEREVEDGATSGGCQDNQGDIGGFAEISGCLDKLTSSEKQVRSNSVIYI